MNQGKSYEEILDIMVSLIKGVGTAQKTESSPEKRLIPVRPKESMLIM